MKKIVSSLLLLVLLLVQNPFNSYNHRTDRLVNAAADRYNMSYIYFGSPSTYINQVNQTKNSLNMVSPNYFDITETGELDVTWKLQSSFIDQVHDKGMKVVPFLSNHWHRVNGTQAMERREQLAQEVVDAIQKYNLDGVNVDIEGITVTYRNEFTDFIRILRELMPAGKELSVAVAANPSGWNTGWHGFYDYKALAEYADYLMIMAYDESWEGSDPGPVASIGFMERSIEYALKQNVPKDKIVLGYPFYGRIWKDDGLPTTEGKNIKGTGVSLFRVDPIIQKYKGTVFFDEKSQTPYAKITIPPEQFEYVGSTKLTEGDYTIWFEDETSLKRKLRLVAKHDVKGTGSWSLYQETNEIWNYYTLWVNGRSFIDVPIGYWAESDILAMEESGWMQGISSTEFAPKGELSRAQGAAIIVRALGLDQLQPKEYKFQDVPENHWARDQIEVAREYGVVEGTGPESFSPNQPMPREQLAVMLARVLKLEPSEEAENVFGDVQEGQYYTPAVIAMHEQDIIEGISEGLFGVGIISSRAEMSALMSRLKATIEANQYLAQSRAE